LMIINSNFDWGCNGIEMDLRQVLACGIGDVSDLWASEFWSALGIGTEIRIENIAELLIKGLRQDCSRVVKRFNEEMFEYYSRLQEMELSPYPLTAEYLERLESKNELTVSVAPSDCQYFVGWKECYAPPYHETICLHPKRVKQQCCELSRYNVCTITGGNYPPKKKSDIIKELNSG